MVAVWIRGCPDTGYTNECVQEDLDVPYHPCLASSNESERLSGRNCWRQVLQTSDGGFGLDVKRSPIGLNLMKDMQKS